MTVPIISFICFNKKGIAAKNIYQLLKSTDDFELHIIDNNSKDGTWEFINSLNDPRIKEKKLFDKNRGMPYSLNYVISQRKKDQFLITMDSDVFIESTDWISKYLDIFNEFPELGILGAEPSEWYDIIIPNNIVSIETISKNSLSYYKSTGVTSCLMCIRPEVFNILGYFNEEASSSDIDICKRLTTYTPYHIGILPSIKISQPQSITCSTCPLNNFCKLRKDLATPECLSIYASRYKHVEFTPIMYSNLNLFYQDISSGKRTPYCASVHDPDSLKNHYYDKKMADASCQFFIDNAN